MADQSFAVFSAIIMNIYNAAITHDTQGEKAISRNLAGRKNGKFARACVAFLNGLSLDKVKHAENFSYKQRSLPAGQEKQRQTRLSEKCLLKKDFSSSP
jgi:hypothetical protein